MDNAPAVMSEDLVLCYRSAQMLSLMGNIFHGVVNSFKHLVMLFYKLGCEVHGGGIGRATGVLAFRMQTATRLQLQLRTVSLSVQAYRSRFFFKRISYFLLELERWLCFTVSLFFRLLAYSLLQRLNGIQWQELVLLLILSNRRDRQA